MLFLFSPAYCHQCMLFYVTVCINNAPLVDQLDHGTDTIAILFYSLQDAYDNESL